MYYFANQLFPDTCKEWLPVFAPYNLDHCDGEYVHMFACLCVNTNASQHKKASNHHANLPLEMYSFTL